ARARIERSDEGDEEEGPKIPDQHEARACSGHKETGGEQQVTTLIPIREHADPQSEESGSNERSRDDGTDGKHAETKLKEIDGQEHRYRAVREGSHGTRCQDLQRILRCPLRD